jgi:hypothetical protein
MDAEDMTNKLEMGECLLIAQEVKGKSDVWNTFVHLSCCGKYWRSIKM